MHSLLLVLAAIGGMTVIMGIVVILFVIGCHFSYKREAKIIKRKPPIYRVLRPYYFAGKLNKITLN